MSEIREGQPVGEVMKAGLNRVVEAGKNIPGTTEAFQSLKNQLEGMREEA